MTAKTDQAPIKLPPNFCRVTAQVLDVLTEGVGDDVFVPVSAGTLRKIAGVLKGIR